MGKNNIQIFCRLLPLQLGENQVPFQITPNTGDNLEIIEFFDENNRKHQTPRGFWFNKIFNQEAEQLDVFDAIARDTTQRALDGYNGTIFAYGQTGTGKTHTIVGKDRHGGAEVNKNSGIIPRSLEYLFSQIVKIGLKANVSLSYLEIYREVAYDLMNQISGKKGKVSLGDLQQVICRMDVNNELHMIKLKLVDVENLQEALAAFAKGSRNRQMAETSMNDASSRSHCVFTVHLKHTVEGRLLSSKINFVDLAGSERVGKYHEVDGKLLAEAKNINQTLFYLQNVIVALGKLQKKGRSDKSVHVPFRNAVITNILRDSLGGNCKTSMIATIRSDLANLNETISTCKFAQRVAELETYVKINVEEDFVRIIEELKFQNLQLAEDLKDANNEIEKLRQENLELKEKLKICICQDENNNNRPVPRARSDLPLTQEEKSSLERALLAYFESGTEVNFKSLGIEEDERTLRYCLKFIKTEKKNYNSKLKTKATQMESGGEPSAQINGAHLNGNIQLKSEKDKKGQKKKLFCC